VEMFSKYKGELVVWKPEINDSGAAISGRRPATRLGFLLHFLDKTRVFFLQNYGLLLKRIFQLFSRIFYLYCIIGYCFFSFGCNELPNMDMGLEFMKVLRVFPHPTPLTFLL
jgi:hypothetical protein